MDDSALWADTPRQLVDHLQPVAHYLHNELALTLKPSPYINRTEHGMDFLGCRIFPYHTTLNRRSRVRFRRKLLSLEHAHLAGRIDDITLQQRASSLVAFTRPRGVSSWRFRRGVLESMPVSGHNRPRSG
jgi:hypothetical protein